MHPEYPCAHFIVSASLAAVLAAEIDSGTTPALSSLSSTAGGAVRTWKSADEFVAEVAVARIYDGVHYLLRKTGLNTGFTGIPGTV